MSVIKCELVHCHARGNGSKMWDCIVPVVVFLPDEYQLLMSARTPVGLIQKKFFSDKFYSKGFILY